MVGWIRSLKDLHYAYGEHLLSLPPPYRLNGPIFHDVLKHFSLFKFSA